jgi:hypothetical protein
MNILGLGLGRVLEIRNTSSRLGQLLVGGQGSENFRLAQRQQDVLVLLGVRHDKVLNLSHSQSGGGDWRLRKGQGGLTSSPHSRASRSLPLALVQISRSCYEDGLVLGPAQASLEGGSL